MDSKLKKQLQNSYTQAGTEVKSLKNTIKSDQRITKGSVKDVNEVDERYGNLVNIYKTACPNPHTLVDNYTIAQISDPGTCKATYGSNDPKVIAKALKNHSHGINAQPILHHGSFINEVKREQNNKKQHKHLEFRPVSKQAQKSLERKQEKAREGLER